MYLNTFRIPPLPWQPQTVIPPSFSLTCPDTRCPLATYGKPTPSTTSWSPIPIPPNRRQSLYDSSVPLRSNPKMARTLYGNSADPYRCKIKRNHPLGDITRLKKVMQPNDENAYQTNPYQVSHTCPTTLKFSWLPPAPADDRWAYWFHGYDDFWNNSWQISVSRVLKDPHSNTLKITSSPCGCREPFMTFTLLKSNSFP